MSERVPDADPVRDLFERLAVERHQAIHRQGGDQYVNTATQHTWEGFEMAVKSMALAPLEGGMYSNSDPYLPNLQTKPVFIAENGWHPTKEQVQERARHIAERIKATCAAQVPAADNTIKGADKRELFEKWVFENPSRIISADYGDPRICAAWDGFQFGCASLGAAQVPAGWNEAIEAAAKRIENGSFLHDKAPAKLFANELAPVIRSMKRAEPTAGAAQVPSLSETDLWYLQDTRTYIGNDVTWWAKDGNGYTTDVSKAHAYTREQAFRQAAMRGCDRAWPKAYIDGKTRPAVDFQHINHDEAIAIAAKETTQ